MNLEQCFSEGLLRPFKFERDAIEKEISVSKRYILDVNKCIREEMYDLAVVAVYTSMFHAARAILFRDGFKERSHICLIEYVREKYPYLNEFVKVLDIYRESRHAALYGIDVNFIKEDATYGMKVAEKFIERVEEEIGIDKNP